MAFLKWISDKLDSLSMNAIIKHMKMPHITVRISVVGVEGFISTQQKPRSIQASHPNRSK